MNIFKSLHGFGRASSTDLRFTFHGARPGWYLRTYYRGRLENRADKPPSLTTVCIKVNGTPITLFVTPQHLGALAGVFLDNEYDLRKTLPDFKPENVLDLGANVGMAAAYLAALYPAATFQCVEPDPRNHPLLERTIETNSIRAIVVNSAVASDAGTLQLRMGDDPTCSALETSPMHKLHSATAVKVVTVPELLEQVGWESVDLVKIDIEGTEKELLGRNNEWLKRVKVIVLEIHPNTSPEEIGQFLAPFNFRLSRLGNGREPVYMATRP